MQSAAWLGMESLGEAVRSNVCDSHLAAEKPPGQQKILFSLVTRLLKGDRIWLYIGRWGETLS